MNYRQSYEAELENAMKRHNEQVSKQITEKVLFGQELNPAIHAPCIQVALTLDRVIEKQRAVILKALDAIQRGNYDDAKKILEMI